MSSYEIGRNRDKEVAHIKKDIVYDRLSSISFFVKYMGRKCFTKQNNCEK